MKTLLLLAAFGQLCLAVIGFNMVRLLGWREEVARMPLLVRQVFHVHTWFISLTVFIFAALTWRFAGEMSAEPMGRWLAACIGIFWGVRAVLQVTYYRSSHWRGIPSRTLVHGILLVVYPGWAVLYLWTALAPPC